MRGKIDLGAHKLANVYRAPASRSRWRFPRREKCPDEVYRQLWNLVAGGVRDTFANHPEYLTERGRMAAERSICKRVTGTLYGYATQVAGGRSVQRLPGLTDAAAERTGVLARWPSSTTWFVRAVSWMARSFRRHLGRCFGVPARNSSGDHNG